MKKSELRQLIREEIGKLNEKHGVIPNINTYLKIVDPDYDASDSDYVVADKIERRAAALGLLDDLLSAVQKTYWGRYDDPSSGDELAWRSDWIKNTKNRITKNGKLNKNSATWLKNAILRHRKTNNN